MSEKKSGQNFLDFLSKYSKNIIIVLSSLALVAAVVAGGLWYYYKVVNKDVLAVVGSEKITRQDLNQALFGIDFAGSATNPGSAGNAEAQKILLAELVERSVVKQEAEKRGVTVSDTDVKAAALVSEPDFENRSSEEQAVILEVAKSQLLKEALRTKIQTYVDGGYILVRFDKYLGNNNDTAKYAKEKTEATTYVATLKSDLSTGKTTFAKAQEAVLAHPTFGTTAFSAAGFNALITGNLNKDVYENNLGIITDSSFLSLVSGTQAGKTSEPTLLKVSVSSDGKTTSQVDGLYAIVKVDSIHKGEADNYETWLSEKVAEYSSKSTFPIKTIANVLGAQKVYAAIGTCNGGLVTSGSSSPAGYYVRLRFIDAAGAVHALSGSTVNVDAGSSGAFGTYSWGGVTKSCDTDSLVQTSGTDSFPSSHTFTVDSAGETRLGYTNCGGNGYALLCSCADFPGYYSFNPGVAGTHPWVTTGGHWHEARRYTSSGTYDIFTDEGGTSINPFSSRSVTNGATQGVYLYYQGNHKPAASYVSPAASAVFTTSTTGGTASVPMVMSVSDIDKDDVAGQIAYRVVGTNAWKSLGCINDTNGPSGATVTAINTCAAATLAGVSNWGWMPTTGTGGETEIAQPHTFTFPAQNLPVGTYEWAVRGRDMHEVFSDWVTGRTFTVRNADINFPTCSLSVAPATVATGGSAVLTWTTTNATTRTSSWAGLVVASGTATVVPGATTTYTLSATNAVGTTTCPGATVQVVNPSLTCPVTPPSGDTPLVVRVAPAGSGGAVGPWDYDMGDGTTIASKPSPFWYTYSTKGTYQIRARTNDQVSVNKVGWTLCGPVNPTTPGVTTVTVTDPSDSTGGEVRP